MSAGLEEDREPPGIGITCEIFHIEACKISSLLDEVSLGFEHTGAPANGLEFVDVPDMLNLIEYIGPIAEDAGWKFVERIFQTTL